MLLTHLSFYEKRENIEIRLIAIKKYDNNITPIQHHVKDNTRPHVWHHSP